MKLRERMLLVLGEMYLTELENRARYMKVEDPGDKSYLCGRTDTLEYARVTLAHALLEKDEE